MIQLLYLSSVAECGRWDSPVNPLDLPVANRLRLKQKRSELGMELVLSIVFKADQWMNAPVPADEKTETGQSKIE